MNEQQLCLNADYHFRNDNDRIIMYSKKQVQDYSSPLWISYIHPAQAMLLYAYTKDNILFGKQREILTKFHLTEKTADELIRPFVENEEPIYTEFKGQKVWFPKNVLIYPDGKKVTENKRYVVDFNCEKIDLTPDRNHKAPQYLLFMLTNKCVTNCKYCYADRHTKCQLLSTTEILRIVREARKLGLSYIDVIGGEVFCRKDWNIILKEMVDQDLMPSYVSTKVPITEKQVKKLFETGYKNVVQISLDSMNEDVLQIIIKCGGGYVGRMKHTIELLSSYGFPVQIDTILTKYNSSKESLLELFDYIKSIKNLVYWEIRIPEDSIYSPKDFKEIQASKEQLEKLGSFIRNVLIPDAGFAIYFSDEALNFCAYEGKTNDKYFKGGSCGMLTNRMFILPDGKVSICEQLYWHPQFIIGDLTKQTIPEVWNSPKALALFNRKHEVFRKESRCYSCKNLDMCTAKHRRCFVKVIKAYGQDNWDYPDPRCQYAPKIESCLIYK